MPNILCPTCGRPFDPHQSSAMPFCCARCRDIDLGRWLTEENAISVEPSYNDEDEA